MHHREIARILFEDESMIRDYQALRGAKLMGTIDYETGEIYIEDHVQYDAQVFLSFIENIVAMRAFTMPS